MMWQLLHRLFRYQYVLLRSGAMDYRYIRRIYSTPSGGKYVVFSGETIWFLLDNGVTDNGYSWTALTW